MKILPIAILVIIVGLAAFILLKKPTQQSTTNKAVQTKQIPNTNPENWVNYSSTEHNFSLRHPSEVEISLTEEGVTLTQVGPSQKTGTELYDGISINITSGLTSGKIFDEYVSSQYALSRDEVTTDEISDLETVTINGLSGYKYTVSSVGSSSFIFLPQGDMGYLKIINSTVEPTNSSNNFKKIAENVINSIIIEKNP